MHMSGSHDNDAVTEGNLIATDAGMTTMQLNTSDRGTAGRAWDERERDAKRQRSADWTGLGQIETEEGDFASACLAEDVMAGVLEHDAGW